MLDGGKTIEKAKTLNVETTAQKTSNWVIEYGGNEVW